MNHADLLHKNRNGVLANILGVGVVLVAPGLGTSQLFKVARAFSS